MYATLKTFDLIEDFPEKRFIFQILALFLTRCVNEPTPVK